MSLVPFQEMAILKTCSLCSATLPLHCFSKNKARKDGLQERCNSCRSLTRKVSKAATELKRKRHQELYVANTLPDTDAAYIAGLFDGEGSINMFLNHSRKEDKRQETYGIRICITNTYPGILEWVAQTVGFGKVYNKRVRDGYKKAWLWFLVGSRAISFLRSVYPFLKIKKLQADVAFRYEGTIGDRLGRCLTKDAISERKTLKVELSRLNGHTPLSAVMLN